ncbi:MucR family transcriptional regulator [Hyphococcus sp.]|uniref:MucR family transcriptional regulator n=1 Tax=Hyphococcus sp. TaxID=2038636 RepID=UPI003CCBBB04
MATKKPDSPEAVSAIHLASDIVAAYVGNNSVKTEELPALLHDVYTAVSGLAEEGAAFISNREPAVPINKSVTPDFVICLEDGKKLKMLKRYLRTHYNLSPEEYRRKWGLPADYPMVAPNYAKRRSQFAKDIGLGTAATKKRRTVKKKKTTRKKRA